jgi:hypothetical protein
MSEPVVRIFDNPILTAQARRRLRPTQLLSSALISGLLGICGVLLSVVAKDQREGFTSLSYVLLSAIGMVLLLRGSNRVAEAVREERESGLLDFHRATPTTPWTDGLGYLLGCPSREYLIAGILAAFALGAAPLSKFGLPVMACSLLVLLVNTLLFHSFALWVGLSVAHRRGASGIVVGTLLSLLLAGWSVRGFGAIAYFTPYPALIQLLSSSSSSDTQVTFFGMPIPALALTVLVQVSMLVALGQAIARKLRQDDATSFSRLGTLYLFAWIAFLSLGAAWQWIVPAAGSAPQGASSDHGAIILLGYLTLATLLAAALLLGQVPTYLTLLRALRRAKRVGTTELSWLDEGGRTETLTCGLWVLTIAGLFVISRAMGPRVTGPLLGEPVALVVAAVLVYLLFVQSASEYVRFRHRAAPQAVAVLVFFASHILPFLLSFVFGGPDKLPGQLVMAASPLFAIESAAAQLSQHWLSGSKPSSLQPLSLYVSLAVTLALSAFFFIESRRSQRALARKIAASPSAA